MITRDTLVAAVDDGLLTEMQAVRLLARAEGQSAAADVDDERFRFLNGFNDVFLALGVVLIAGAFVAFMMFFRSAWPVVAAIAVVVMWGLGEIVIRRYRAVLPAIFISVAITLFAGVVFGQIFSSAPIGQGLAGLASLKSQAAMASLLVFVVVFYWRFRLPFTVGTIGVLVYGCVFLVFGYLLGGKAVIAWHQFITLGSGLVLFSIAVAYDVSDPNRLTRRADCAFWLHMVAVPMITHGLLAQFATRIDTVAVMAILAGFVIFALVSLALDRRVPLVSVLLYLGIAIGYLFSTVTLKATLAVGATLLLLGIIVVTMGLAWRPLRRLLLRPLSRFAFTAKLPPLRLL